MAKHPQVHLSNPKELHFFSNHFSRGLSWYCSHFEKVRQAQRCGEITPYYIFHPLAPARIAAAMPRAKLIVLLRDPVEWALSQYFHSRRLGLEPLWLGDALAAEPDRLADADSTLVQEELHLSHHQHSYLSRSRYEQQLPRYMGLFPQEKLLVLRSEDLFLEGPRIWMQLLDFLQLEANAMPELPHAYAGDGDVKNVDNGLRHMLADQLAPTYRWVEQHYGIVWPESVGL